ncbi:MAG: hypothetical protein KBE91_03115 [Bacteroidia bacterium]|nr:hypothetical protein [Bacteroidia bacterium]MBP9688573.1 hypothetical protein [Bacteroidia bacterium]
MNFFSHFFVDGKINQHEYNTGLLLPDITRGYIKSFKPLIPNLSNDEVYFREGCLKHYLADKHFHASVFFNNILNLANTIILDAKFSAALNRKWFLAHILAELMIDRILVKLYPESLNQFYYSLENISDNSLERFLVKYGMKETNNFFDFFNHFRKVQYIGYYPDNNKFVYSLNRIMIKAGVGEISEHDKAVLLQCSLELEKQLTTESYILIEQLKLSVQ